MSNLIAVPVALPVDTSNRRLIKGLLVSLLLHALVLSLHFGISGLTPGPGGPLAVRLVPLPAPAQPPLPAVPAQVRAQILDNAPPTPAPSILPPAPRQPSEQAQPTPAPAPAAREGFTLLDPSRPQPAPPSPAIQPKRAPLRRARARAPAIHDGLHTRVIAHDQHKDEGFSLPPVNGEAQPDPDPLEKTTDTAAGTAAPEPEPALAQQPVSPPDREPAAPTEHEVQAERERLAAQREQERAARREADEQALRAAADADARRVAGRQARELARQDARYEDELAVRQQQAAEQRRLAAEALERSQREEAQRQAAARALAEQQRAQAEQERARQLAEQQRVQAEQERAQQLAEQQRVRAEQEHAQQLAEQQRLQAEQLARAQAEQAERLARESQARQRDAGGDMNGLNGAGRGGGLPQAALEGRLASRARELLRGIDLDKPVPQAVRPAEDAQRQLRRALANTVLRDVPLRMYVDSIRQKIERNALVSPSRLADDTVRIYPVVSVAIRSDGTVEDVTIVRSSGRADLDETVRRVVHLNARYAAFPPNVAANYDVVELRRVWSFSGVLRLLEEMR